MDEDQRLLSEFVKGNSPDAFARLVERHAGMVRAAALRAVADAHLADDVTQAVFLLLLRRAGRIKSSVVLAGWLFNVTRNISADMVKIQRRRKRHEAEALPLAVRENCAETDWERLTPLLNDAVAKLRGSDRDAIVLRFFEGREYEEIGDSLGVSAGAARMRVSRAVAKLRARLHRAGMTIAPEALEVRLLARAAHAVPRTSAIFSEAEDAVRDLVRRMERRRKKKAAVLVALVAGVAILLMARVMARRRPTTLATLGQTAPADLVARPAVDAGGSAIGFRFEGFVTPAFAQRISDAARRPGNALAAPFPARIERTALVAILSNAKAGDFVLISGPSALTRAGAGRVGQPALSSEWTDGPDARLGGESVHSTLTVTYLSPAIAGVSCNVQIGADGSRGIMSFQTSADPKSGNLAVGFVPIKDMNNQLQGYEMIAVQLGAQTPESFAQWLAPLGLEGGK